MAGPHTSRKPTFFWQAVLILLPMVVLAAVSLWGLRQDRAAVERDAREQAGTLLQTLAREFGVRAGVHMALTQLQAADQQKFLFACSQWRVAQDPNLLFPFMKEGPGAVEESGRINLISPPGGPSPDLIFDSGGDLVQPPARFQNPQPPAWYRELNRNQRAAWDELGRKTITGGATDEVKPAVAQFLETSPPPHARAAAEYLRLRTSLADAPPAEAMAQWLRFGDRCGGVLPIAGTYQSSTDSWQDAESEAGLPLATLATVEAVRLKIQPRFVADEWQSIAREVWIHPSALTEPLLDCVATRAEGNGSYRTWEQRMRQRVAQVKETLALADVIRHQAQFDVDTTNCLWVDGATGKWLCILQPFRPTPANGQTNALPGDGAARIGAFLYSMPMIVSAFSNALQSIASVRPVRYLALTVELAGEPVPVPAPWAAPLSAVQSKVVFATAQGRLSSPAVTWAALKDGTAAGLGYEALSAHPHFTLGLRLVNPGLMYAAQQRRARLYTGLVVTAALAAFVGFVAAWRSFHRQLQLSEMKSNFVSSVSHELRAPIASVRLLAENLEGGKIPEPRKQKEYFGFIVQECRRLSALIENVLDFSRIEQGRKQYEFEPTDLVALVQTTVKLMEPNAAEKGVSLKEETSLAAPERGEGGNIEMEIDGRAIQQALVNLIDNAIKHSPKGETVTVEIKSSAGVSPAIENKTTAGTAVLLSVSDHGPGIPPEEHKKIFERFYRRGSELRRETQGVGIGLSIVKHIVEAHGGRVLVESVIGHGSRFVIELPIQP